MKKTLFTVLLVGISLIICLLNYDNVIKLRLLILNWSFSITWCFLKEKKSLFILSLVIVFIVYFFFRYIGLMGRIANESLISIQNRSIILASSMATYTNLGIIVLVFLNKLKFRVKKNK